MHKLVVAVVVGGGEGRCVTGDVLWAWRELRALLQGAPLATELRAGAPAAQGSSSLT